jgi:hypothetical protein
MKALFYTVILGLLTANLTAHSATKIESLVAKITESSERVYIEEGELRTISRVTPRNLYLPRSAEYLSLLGYTIGTEYFPMHMSSVSEKWTFDGAMNWKIEQWVFRFDLIQKKLAHVSHKEIHETLDGKILDIAILDSKEADDPESIAKWEEILAKWTEWRK